MSTTAILIPTLYALVGGFCYAVVNHVLIATVHRDGRAMHLLFAGLCLTGIFFDIASIAYFSASSSEGLVEIRRLLVVISACVSITFLWFLATFSGSHHPVRHSLMCLALLPALIANQTMPYGISWNSPPGFSIYKTPWGELLTVASHYNNPWASLFIVPFFFNFIYMFALIYMHWRRHRSASSLAMMICYGMLLLLAAQGSLVRHGWLPLLPMGPWAFALVPISMSFVLGIDIQRHDRRLREIIDAVPALVNMRSLSGRFLLVNKRFCDFVGKTSSQLVGRKRKEISTQQQVTRWNDHDQDVVRERRALC